MNFSYWITNSSPWQEALAAGKQAEALGYHGLWYADHFMPNAKGPVPGPAHEAFTVLAALAATVPRVRLGTLVAGNTYRNPAVLAKTCATIDQISEGRVVVGIGAGWQENEHRAYGIPFETFGWRFDRLEEACQVITSLFTEASVNFDGEHYTLVDAPLDPKPVQSPPPLLVGGGGERRTLRIVARYAQEWNVWGLPPLLAQKGAVLEQRCAEEGRDPATIRRSAQALLFLTDDQATLDRLRSRPIERPTVIGSPAEVQEVMAAYRDARVDEFIVPGFTFRTPAERAETLERFQAEVMAPLGWPES
ncbi:MAG: TIGR03560 family F420-dependent LLM class oxidoreductase [Acidimicrobiia bacterium]|nr:TIGR03560 family F420-dependent LLM class oxidoreductase [Acidimicrobiia bacterium]